MSAALVLSTNAMEELDPRFEFEQHGDKAVTQVLFSPDSKMLITKANRNDEPVLLLDAQSGQIRCAWARSYRISSNVAPNGRWLFVDTEGNNDAHFRDITNCNAIQYLDNLPIYNHFDTRFSIDGRRLAGTAHQRRPIFNRNRRVFIYDIDAKMILNYVSHPSSNMIGMSDDKFHYFRDGETVLLWTQVHKTRLTEDGEKIKSDRRVLLQNVLTEEIFREWHFKEHWYQLAIHPDEMRLAIFNRRQKTILVEDLRSGVKHVEWHIEHTPHAMEYHPDGRWLITVSRQGVFTAFDVASQEIASQYRIIKNVNRDGLRIAPNGQSFAIGTSDGKVAVYRFKVD